MNFRAVLAASVAAALIACSDGGGGPASPDAAPADAVEIDTPPLPIDAPIDAFVIPVLRNPVALPDDQLAAQASALLGPGGTKNCDRCHAASRDQLRAWRAMSDRAVTSCITDVAPDTQAEAQSIVDCLRAQPGVATSGWPPHQLGIYATAVRLDWFAYVWRLAFGASGDAELEALRGEAAMPRSAEDQFTQAEFDLVAEWFARGLPMLDVVIPADPPPTTCTTTISPEMETHASTMAVQGWRALNIDAGLNMFGCTAGQTGRQCLSTYPRPNDSPDTAGWENPLTGQVIRILRENRYRSSYWTRSSADGRYVSHGGASVASSTYRSTIIDLVQNREIPAAALYDPGFFPDNSGFALQGPNTNSMGTARFCEQSLLNSNPTMVTFSEPQCLQNGAVGLYQHLGAMPGGDYWTVDGQFTNDNGGHMLTQADPSSTFSSTASIDLTPMVHTGTQFVPQPRVRILLPREGDVIMSPSGKLLVSRVSAGNGQALYLVRKMLPTVSGSTYTIQVPEVARYCLRGAKPAISFDERWLVYHHYVEAGDWQSLGYASATDPAFVALRAAGAANIFLIDMPTGQVRRITTMRPGQYALFPHFRSDGWIYYMVREPGNDREFVVASDAALLLESQ